MRVISFRNAANCCVVVIFFTQKSFTLETMEFFLNTGEKRSKSHHETQKQNFPQTCIKLSRSIMKLAKLFQLRSLSSRIFKFSVSSYMFILNKTNLLHYVWTWLIQRCQETSHLVVIMSQHQRNRTEPSQRQLWLI